MNFTISRATLIICLCIFVSLSGCSTTEVTPSPLPSPPVYTQVPHPVGMDLGDISAIFTDEKAPQDKDFSKNCDSDFRKLEKLAKSRDEVLEGLRELVKQEPVVYHWCFYSKVLELENGLKAGKFIDQRQKLILEAFAFLAPLARTYSTEFHDSRYLRMAISRYQKWSEWIFYRKLELTPAGTSELVKASNPFGLWRDTLETVSVLEKYHILKATEAAKSKVPEPNLPAPMASPSVVPAEAATEPAAAAPTADLISEEPEGGAATEKAEESPEESAPAPNLPVEGLPAF